MMSQEQFITALTEKIKEKCPPQISLLFSQTRKRNGILLDGVSKAGTGRELEPMVYLNHFYPLYQGGRSLSCLADMVLALMENGPKSIHLSPDDFLNYDKVKEKLVFRLLNRNWNRELLQEMPHLDFLDLAVVFYFMLDEPDFEDAVIPIRNEHLPLWGKTEQDLYKDALITTPKRLPWECSSMESILMGVCPVESEPDITKQIYVLSNSARYHGSAAVLYPGVLHQIAQNLESDLILVPSSIHEFLIIPDCIQGNTNSLNAMIREVNREELTKSDWLSDHFYRYDRIEMAIKE